MVANYALVEDGLVADEKPIADTPFARFLWGVMQRRGGAKPLSQRQVQAFTGISASQVGDWLYKGINPQEASVNKLAPWLHMKPTEIWQVIAGSFSYDEAMERYEAAYDDIDAQIEAWLQQGMNLLHRRRTRRQADG